jgi:hypothetical protein
MNDRYKIVNTVDPYKDLFNTKVEHMIEIVQAVNCIVAAARGQEQYRFDVLRRHARTRELKWRGRLIELLDDYLKED